MSEGKAQWFIGWDGTVGGYSLIAYGSDNSLLIKFEHEDREQRERLAAWLNHIAPDGVIPVVPNDRESASE